MESVPVLHQAHAKALASYAKNQLRNTYRIQGSSKENYMEVFSRLETKKDYKLRADDYNNKKQVLKHLRKKALNKNPDEFYFHMSNSKIVDGGIHRDLLSKKSKSKDGGGTTTNANMADQIRLMQTQDYKYVSMRRVMEQKKIEKLKGALHLLDVDASKEFQ